MGAWGIKALERDEGLDVLDILKNEYVPEHPVMDLGEMIELMKEEVMLGSDFSQIDFLFDNTAMALAELYFQWKDNSKLDYDHEEAIWDKVTGFTASKEALAFLLRQLTDIKNEVPDEDGIREIVDLWKNEDSGEIAPAWLEHLNQLIDRLDSEQEARQKLPTHVNLDAPVPGLYRDSIILLEQLRTIDKSRLRDKLGSLGEDQMCKLDHALEVSVGLLPIYNTI